MEGRCLSDELCRVRPSHTLSAYGTLYSGGMDFYSQPPHVDIVNISTDFGVGVIDLVRGKRTELRRP